MHSSRVVSVLAALGIAIGVVAGAASAQAAAAQGLQINVLSTRADLVSGGQALTSIDVPAGTAPTVTLNGQDVSAEFAWRPNGQFEGLLTGLATGSNTVTATLPDGSTTSSTIIDHPIGGPIFSGPQVQPWVCQSGATDAQCDAPSTYAYYYMPALDQQQLDAVTGPMDLSDLLQSYDPSNPPPAQAIATTTTDNGTTVPYIVRVETGYLDRDQYSIAMLWQPGQSWAPWAPQPQWDHKLVITHGASCGADHQTGTAPSTTYDPALRRGMAVMSTAMDNAGHDCSVLTEAESLIMAKERLIDEYGTLRYTIGTGCSGGSLAQQQVANAYPGVYQGILPQCSFPDSWSTGQQLGDYQLTRNYFENPSGWGSGIAWTPAQIAAVQGHPNYANSVELSTLYWPTLANPAYACAGVTDAQRWSPTNPTGTRCDLEDYMINLFGPYMGNNPYGYAGIPLDNVGVQYGLQPLEQGLITPEQFVDLNQKIGGYDHNFNTTTSRLPADEPALRNDYRGGGVNETNDMKGVAIIDLRGPDAGSFHDAYRSWTIRARLEQVEGHFPKNDVIWFGETPLIGDPNYAAAGLVAMDGWLSAVEADHRNLSLEQKVADDRPATVHDQCSDIPDVDQVVVPGVGEVCQSPLLQTRFATPRMVAGESINTDQEKCQLKPLRASDYYPVTFSATEWATLQQIFPHGVCNFAKPGVDQAPTIPWQTYQSPSGSVIYGGKPLGPAPAGSGGGWTSPSFAGWTSQ
ncbi:MAG TPA: DUF6351 family protein [Solirubrobacteraceae bacterium]|nr:DUF6351 family protein [Solirubrobacteraceae bacterium]